MSMFSHQTRLQGGTILFAGVVAVCLVGVLSAAPSTLEPDGKRLAEIERMLSPGARGVGSPIDDRAIWSFLPSLPGYEETIKELWGVE